METSLYLISLALAPVIFIFTLIYLLDKHDKEPLIRLILCFVFGVLTAFPAIYMEEGLARGLGVFPSAEIMPTFLFAFVVVAFSEEFVKFAVLMTYGYRSKEFDEPYDGIMYALAISLGFAAIENVLYVTSAQAEGHGFEVAMMRMFTAVPGHAMMAIAMGYFVGLAKFNKANQGRLIFTGLLAAIVIHGLYDFFLMWRQDYVALLAFVVLIVSFVLSIRAVKIHRRNSPHAKSQG